MRILDGDLEFEEFDWLISAVLDACKTFRKQLIDLSETERYKHCLEAFGFMLAINQMGEFGVAVPDLTGEASEDINAVRLFVDELEARLQAALADRRAREGIKERRPRAKPVYEFSDVDLSRIQTLINELRGLIRRSRTVGEEHKRRLQNRLEQLQGELHKTVSDLDRFWGLLGDAGAALGKFGQDAKPIVDRLREFVDILTRTQRRAQGALPSEETNALGQETPSSENYNDE